MERGAVTAAWRQALAELRAAVNELPEPGRGRGLQALYRLGILLEPSASAVTKQQPCNSHAVAAPPIPARMVGLSAPDQLAGPTQPEKLARTQPNAAGVPAGAAAFEIFRAAWLDHQGSLFDRMREPTPKQLAVLAEVRAWAGEKYPAMVRVFFSPRCAAKIKQLSVFLNPGFMQFCGNVAGVNMDFPAWRQRRALAAAEEAKRLRNLVIAAEDAANDGRPRPPGPTPVGQCLPFELQ